jgi:hypothetical protein
MYGLGYIKPEKPVTDKTESVSNQGGSNKRQKSQDSRVLQQQAEKQTQFENDFGIMLITCNLPLNLADHPAMKSFLEKYSRCTVPSSSTLSTRIIEVFSGKHTATSEPLSEPESDHKA